MTQDEIIEMAQECNLIGMRPHLDGIYSESLVAFAHLVAAKEREATKEALAYVKKLEEALATKIRHRYEDSPVALSLPTTTTSHD